MAKPKPSQVSVSVDQSPGSVGDYANTEKRKANSGLPDAAHPSKRLKFANSAGDLSQRIGNAVTPRFWDKAAHRAVETLGTLSPGSRRRLSEIKRSESMKSQSPRQSPRQKRTVPDLLISRTGTQGSFENMTTAGGYDNGPVGTGGGGDYNAPGAAASGEGEYDDAAGATTGEGEYVLGDLPSAADDGSSFALVAPWKGGPHRDLIARQQVDSRMKSSGNRGRDLQSATGARLPGIMTQNALPVKKKRPPRLQIMGDNGVPLDEAGTPLLAIAGTGGRAVGEIPGQRGPGVVNQGNKTLRKAVLERWGGTPRSPALTPNDLNLTMSPTQFLTTPR